MNRQMLNYGKFLTNKQDYSIRLANYCIRYGITKNSSFWLFEERIVIGTFIRIGDSNFTIRNIYTLKRDKLPDLRNTKRENNMAKWFEHVHNKSSELKKI